MLGSSNLTGSVHLLDILYVSTLIDYLKRSFGSVPRNLNSLRRASQVSKTKVTRMMYRAIFLLVLARIWLAMEVVHGQKRRGQRVSMIGTIGTIQTRVNRARKFIRSASASAPSAVLFPPVGSPMSRGRKILTSTARCIFASPVPAGLTRVKPPPLIPAIA